MAPIPAPTIISVRLLLPPTTAPAPVPSAAPANAPMPAFESRLLPVSGFVVQAVVASRYSTAALGRSGKENDIILAPINCFGCGLNNPPRHKSTYGNKPKR